MKMVSKSISQSKLAVHGTLMLCGKRNGVTCVRGTFVLLEEESLSGARLFTPHCFRLSPLSIQSIRPPTTFNS